jgi:hypothetical protein
MKLVSVVTPNFWPGLKALAHSLKHKGGITGLDWIIMTELGVVPDEWYEWLDRQGFNLVSKSFSSVGGDWTVPLPCLPDHKTWLTTAYNKLRVLLLPKDEYILLDTDLLCVNPATELLYTKSISAVYQSAHAPTPPDISFGVVRIDSSPALFEECVGVMKNVGGTSLADQSIFNWVLRQHPEMLHPLDYRWDMMWSLVLHKPSMWLPEDAKFLHFGWKTKPWMDPGGTDVKPQYRGIWNKIWDIWRDYANTNCGGY